MNDDYKVCQTPFGAVSEDGTTCTPGDVPTTTFEWPEKEEDENRFQETSSFLTKNQAQQSVRSRSVDLNDDGLPPSPPVLRRQNAVDPKTAKVHDSIPRQLMTETGKHKPCGKDCFNLKVNGDSKLGKDVVIEFEKTSKAIGNDWKVRGVLRTNTHSIV